MKDTDRPSASVPKNRREKKIGDLNYRSALIRTITQLLSSAAAWAFACSTSSLEMPILTCFLSSVRAISSGAKPPHPPNSVANLTAALSRNRESSSPHVSAAFLIARSAGPSD